MGRSIRRLAKKIRNARQREKLVAMFMSPFGPPAETRDLSDVVTIANYSERMTVADWQEAASAYRRWVVRCYEEHAPRLVDRAQFRVDLDRVCVRCRHCGFPRSDHPEEPEVFFHPLSICLFEVFDGEDARAGVFDPQVPRSQVPLLAPDEEVTRRRPDFIDKSFVCPRCGFIQPLDPRIDVSGVLRAFDAAGWDSEAIGKLVISRGKEGI
jgi:hypothetical protein